MKQHIQRLMLIAGEASGDMLGAELVLALKRLTADQPFPVAFFGAGGPRMAVAGVRLEMDLSAHAVVGVWEVLKNYGKFKGFFDHLLDLAVREMPDVIVLIDYPGFNLRYAHALRKRVRALSGTFGNWKPKIVYYVSPQIWAWHESRIHQIAEDIDLLLSIFPFEKAWYAARKPSFRVEFVGHPLVDRFSAGSQAFSQEHHSTFPIVTILPGSRIRELRKHLPVLLPAVRLIAAKAQARFQMVVPNESLADLARELGCPPEIKLQIGQIAQALAESDLAIASSGTVTMECAFFGVPTVVLYKTSWSTYFLGRRLIKVKYIAMPNLLADEMIYPEFIQDEATAENLASAALDFLNNPGLGSVVKTKLAAVIKSLGEPGASVRAAKAILQLT